MGDEIQGTSALMSVTDKHGIPFRRFVERHERNLPLLVHVTDSSDKDIVKGDVLRLLYTWQRYEAEYEDPQSQRKMRIVIPSDIGGFKPVSQYPLNHVYTTFHEIALDFPASVRVLEDVKIQNTVVRKGEGLKLNRMQMIGTNQYLLCQHMPSNNPLMVPCDLKGKFRRRNDDAVYIAEHLKNRMPILVKLELGSANAIGTQSHEDLGIPENVDMLLTMSLVVQVEHWYRPTKLQFYTNCNKRDMMLKLDRCLYVAPLEEQIGPPQDLSDVLKDPNTTYPIFAIVHDNENCTELPKDQLLVIRECETKVGVVMRGNESHILAPKDYDESTQFRMRGKEYPTPHDLWRSGHTGEVTVWSTVKSPGGYQGSVRSLYRMDRVNLIRKPEENELGRILSTNDTDELEVVELQRTFSSKKAHLGDILVDSTALVGFEEPPLIVGNHSLANILGYGELPMDIAICQVPQVDDFSESDMILICESPFKVLKECTYTVAHMTTYGTNPDDRLTLVIPDFAEAQIRQVKENISVPKNVQKPKSRVHTLSVKSYSQLTGDVMDDGNYVDIDETLFVLSQPDLSDRYKPIRTPPVTPPLSPNTRRPPLYTCRSLPRLVTSSAAPPVPPRAVRKTSLHEESHSLTHVNLPVSLPPKPHQRKIKNQSTIAQSSSYTLPSRHPPAPPRPPRRSASESSDQQNHPSGRIPPVPRPRRLLSDPTAGQTRKTSHGQDYLEAFIINDTTVPKVKPPDDNIITSFDVTQLAGMMRHLEFGDHALVNCVHQNIDGAKLLEIFRSKSSDEEILECLKLGKLSEVLCLKHFVNQSELDKTIPDVKPPADGNISDFGVQELAGLLKHLKFNEQTFQACLAKQINGMILINMDAETMSTELGLDSSDTNFLALQYFKTQSQPGS